MQSISKYILLSCIIGITAVMVSLVFYVYQTGNHSLQQFGTQLAQVFNSSGEPEFTKYVGRYVDGKTVRGTLEKYGGQYLFRVKTKKNPVSFCVVTRPIKNRIITSFEGQGEYSDYSSSSSIYYINSSGMFSTRVLRDEYNTIIGVVFTEKGSSVLTAGVKKAYAPTLANPTEDEVKLAYTEKLKLSRNELQSSNLESKLVALKTNKEKVEKERQQLAEKAAQNNEPLGTAKTDYDQAKEAEAQAQEKVNSAWSDLSNLLHTNLGVNALGHYDITKFSPDQQDTVDNSDLQYWINKFNTREGKNNG